MRLTLLLIIIGIVLFGPGSALAVDGVILIDQNRALAGNVTPGDTPGFPVTISQPGSYRLSSNLTVPNMTTTAVFITVNDVTLDLNGFTIKGPNVCSSPPGFDERVTSCTSRVFDFPFGVSAGGASGVTIFNGVIRGFDFGVSAGPGARIEKLIVEDNAVTGISVNGNSNVIGNVAGRNGFNGIFADGGSVVSQNNVYRNGGNGMIVRASTVQGNQVRRNNVGITFQGPISGTGKSGWANNVLTDNGTHTDGANGIQMGGNVCSNVSCP